MNIPAEPGDYQAVIGSFPVDRNTPWDFDLLPMPGMADALVSACAWETCVVHVEPIGFRRIDARGTMRTFHPLPTQREAVQ